MGSVAQSYEGSRPFPTSSSAIATAIEAAKKLPYWQVNVPPSEREDSCPPFLQGLSAKDIGIISTPNEAYAILSWPEVRETVAANRLDLFQRVPSELRGYLEYMYHLKREYGSVMGYMLRHRLGWEEPIVPKGKRPFEEPDDVKVLTNDWPYGIDERIVHLVVWTKFELPEDEKTGDLTDEARAMVERYVRTTFCERIPENRVIWFKNWKSLKSIRAVEHFHVMLFGPDPDFIREVTGGAKPMPDGVVHMKCNGND